ncbi:predicted protein [Sclerotinia sclerotiorum 1980 UF-70]|uniref:Uncharacterized protein n=1 Tax=Sclerotinia sclerotiorum (strain ATCC 18683 / 1980 / Ss-1) TaxID=665079 RepID=A7F9Q2_SCLS1|nr:predicted protein [Sclerotinia sclerotiorum 1980 UF-70]EDO00463.1 predicted protein [Sclerotinia sclerotiorum 1980 UF-70]
MVAQVLIGWSKPGDLLEAPSIVEYALTVSLLTKIGIKMVAMPMMQVSRKLLDEYQELELSTVSDINELEFDNHADHNESLLPFREGCFDSQNTIRRRWYANINMKPGYE